MTEVKPAKSSSYNVKLRISITKNIQTVEFHDPIHFCVMVLSAFRITLRLLLSIKHICFLAFIGIVMMLKFKHVLMFVRWKNLRLNDILLTTFIGVAENT